MLFYRDNDRGPPSNYANSGLLPLRCQSSVQFKLAQLNLHQLRNSPEFKVEHGKPARSATGSPNFIHRKQNRSIHIMHYDAETMEVLK